MTFNVFIHNWDWTTTGVAPVTIHAVSLANGSEWSGSSDDHWARFDTAIPIGNYEVWGVSLGQNKETNKTQVYYDGDLSLTLRIPEGVLPPNHNLLALLTPAVFGAILTYIAVS